MSLHGFSARRYWKTPVWRGFLLHFGGLVGELFQLALTSGLGLLGGTIWFLLLFGFSDGLVLSTLVSGDARHQSSNPSSSL